VSERAVKLGKHLAQINTDFTSSTMKVRHSAEIALAFPRFSANPAAMRTSLYLTACIGAAGILTGAFGAHTLKSNLLAWGTLSLWQTGVLYHLLHAPALLAACLFPAENPLARRWLIRACRCWFLGIVLFSGSLYGLALGGPHWLGPITPLGGFFLIVGWLCVAGATPKQTGSAPSV
jgi:uncharacterized membrane protein YgdD (TMEM256/DUF423 family)